MRLPIRIVLALLTLLGGVCADRAAADTPSGDIVAGPVISSVTDKGARVWMQLGVAKPVTVTAYEVGRGQVSQVTVDVEGPLPFIADVPVNGLSPSKNYRIEMKLDDIPVKLPGTPLIISTAPGEGTETNFCIGLGSNVGAINGKGTAPAFKEIEKLNPRAFFFLGNSASLPLKMTDWPQTNRQAVRLIADAYSKVRREPDLQSLFRGTPCYAVWNDLDFGLPGSDKSWIYKNEAWSAFQRFWPNPDWGTPDTPGCYFSFTIGDVDFFMLDSRMYRDADTARKTMLGDKQLEWLKKGLAQSTATFKIIGCGSQLIADYPAPADTWVTFQPEQKDFQHWIYSSNITGVVFLSGGRCGEITAINPPASEANGYPLFELTAGPLAGKTLKTAPDNPSRQKAAVLDNNFGTLDFGGTREHRFVTLRLRDENGALQAEQTLFATQLKK